MLFGFPNIPSIISLLVGVGKANGDGKSVNVMGGKRSD